MKAKIVIAEEHTIIRRGVMSMIANMQSADSMNPERRDFTVLGDTDSPSKLMTLLTKNEIDILFLGFSLLTRTSQNPLSGMDGVPLIKWIMCKYPTLKIIVLSPFKNKQLVQMTLEAGAKAYISRDTCEITLGRALNAVMNGESYIERDLMESLFRREMLGQELTPREIDVLRMLCKGLSLTEIAGQINLSNKTVSAHKLRAMEKLDVKNDCQLYYLMAQMQIFDVVL